LGKTWTPRYLGPPSCWSSGSASDWCYI